MYLSRRDVYMNDYIRSCTEWFSTKDPCLLQTYSCSANVHRRWSYFTWPSVTQPVHHTAQLCGTSERTHHTRRTLGRGIGKPILSLNWCQDAGDAFLLWRMLDAIYRRFFLANRYTLTDIVYQWRALCSTKVLIFTS